MPFSLCVNTAFGCRSTESKIKYNQLIDIDILKLIDCISVFRLL
ncbi:hypothetical protein A4U88_4169 [Serratia marcescens]|nr:hypothetical protein A4U88_4169 [Serratia marcescens]